jgi:hypothetical protein
MGIEHGYDVDRVLQLGRMTNGLCSEALIAFTVFLENAGHGGSQAAPIAKKVIEYYQTIRNKEK